MPTRDSDRGIFLTDIPCSEVFKVDNKANHDIFSIIHVKNDSDI